MNGSEIYRAYVADLYSAFAWKVQVMKMSDAQVYAMWSRQDKNEPETKDPKQLRLF